MAQTRIVILGGGFAGISAARQLGHFMKTKESIEVHLVNNENYFVFQPLLPEVVSCSIEPGHILNPIRSLCPLVHFHWGVLCEGEGVCLGRL
jgi:NADH dehydrogenase